MLKILIVCGAGLGSSFACQMTVESVLSDLNVKASLDHSDVSSAAGYGADLVIAASNFESQFKRYDIKSETIFLNNLVDKNEIREKLVPFLKEKGVL